jgi:DNA ligase-1
MEKVLKILKTLSNTKSTNEKIEILKNETGGDSYGLLSGILHLAYNSYMVFNIADASLKKLKKNKKVGSGIKTDITDFIHFLDKQTQKDGCSNKDLDALADILSELNKDVANCCLLVLKKDLRIGMGAKTINKAFPDLIPVFDVQLCTLTSDIPDGKYFVSPKLDGLRCIAIPQDTGYNLLTRNGKPLPFPEIVDVLNTYCGKTGLVFDGEIMGSDWNDSMKVGRKYNRDTSGLRYNIMDSIYLEEWLGERDVKEPIFSRYNRVLDIFTSFNSDWIRIIPHIIMDNKDDMLNFYSYCLDCGFEGIVAKEILSTYDKKKTWFKKKPTENYDLVIVDCI